MTRYPKPSALLKQRLKYEARKLGLPPASSLQKPTTGELLKMLETFARLAKRQLAKHRNRSPRRRTQT